MGRAVVIEDIDREPIAELRYLNAARGGRGTEVERLPIVLARAQLNAPADGELDAIVACSDLQGIVRGRGDEATLLGVAVAELLEELAFDGVLPPCARTGAILAGDLYSVPGADKRGGRGDVHDVWAAFAQTFAWVAGVAGNHDDVSRVGSIGERVHLLDDGAVVELDGVRLGGVGGIIGNSSKPMRRDEETFLAYLDRAIDRGVDILVVHEGPHGDDGQRGNSAIRATIDAGAVPLTICGHDHWANPLYDRDEGVQIVNVDARVVVFRFR